MKGRCFGPIFVDVVAHFLKFFGDKVCAGRGVLATFNLNPARAKHACERTNPFKRTAVKGENCGDAKSERPFGLQPIIDLLYDFIELAKAVLSFLASSLLGVGDELNF